MGIKAKGQKLKRKSQNTERADRELQRYRADRMRIFIVLSLIGGCSLAGFSSLRIMPGGREAAMGNSGAASAFGPQAMVWNPAGIAGGERFAVRAGYSRWLLDTDQQSLFLVRDARLFRVGLGLTGFSAGVFEYRDDVPTEDPLGLFRPAELGFHLCFARSFGRVVDAGMSGRFYYTKVHEYEAMAPGLDLGLRLRPFANFTLGASIVDFSRPLSYIREQSHLPVRGRLGAAWSSSFPGGFEMNLAADGSWFFRDQSPAVSVGAEGGWGGMVFLRAGYERMSEVGRLSTGLGLRVAGFSCDYSFTLLNDDFGQAHRVSVAWGR